MSNSVSGSLSDIAWMVGPWAGSLGPQTVEEAWSRPDGGVMSTMVRLGSADSVDMIELIAIREVGETLVLHLRQFGPDLSVRHTDDMRLDACDAQSVSFVSPGAAIEGLAYTRLDDQTMRVEVTITGGTVLAADLSRS